MSNTSASTVLATAAAREKYTPQAKEQRAGIGLCLSGGGFRATLFHLGALRRLNELGVLSQVHSVSAVSGGSITAGHIATTIPWPLKEPLAYWEERIARPLRAFSCRDIRTWPVLRRIVLPWKWFHASTAVETLATTLERRLTAHRLHELPETPNFIFCATDMAFGDNWVFERNRMGAYLPGYVTPHQGDWPLARAIAASACFPPVFNPLPMPFAPRDYTGGKAPDGPPRDAAISDLRLTDGGVYDNFGLEPVWKSHAIVLVSDGGALLDYESDQHLVWRIKRYTAIIENQAGSLRKRWLVSNFLSGELDGAYWGIGSARTSYDSDDTQGYSKDVARDVIAKIRTDLDAFSEAESAILENHGYFLADAAVRKHVPQLLPTPVPALKPPHPQWLDEAAVRKVLRGSSRRKIWGR